MTVGDTFKHETTAVGWHLWVVLSEPVIHNDADCVLAASVTTKRDKKHEDHSCILTIDDHPFLQHESWMRFDRAQLMKISFIKGYTQESDPLAEDVILRVLIGAQNSDRIALGHHRLLNDQGLFSS